MPLTLFGFIRRATGWSQLWVSLLAIAVFILNTAPLEMQRRILNTAVHEGSVKTMLVLAIAYAAIVLSEGLIKLWMNIYRGWIGEKVARALRLAASAVVASMSERRESAPVQGVEISLIIAEPDPIGGFVGMAISELVLQVGILLSVFGYMLYIHPLLAILCLGVYSPQFVFVPMMQAAINRRVSARINVLREASAGVLLDDMERALRRKLRFAHIFQLNLGIIKLRYSMKFLVNLTHNVGRIAVLAIGGWLIIGGDAEIGTVVAFVSGLNNVHDPWGDLVNWYQEMMVTRSKYGMFVAAMTAFAGDVAPAGRESDDRHGEVTTSASA